MVVLPTLPVTPAIFLPQDCARRAPAGGAREGVVHDKAAAHASVRELSGPRLRHHCRQGSALQSRGHMIVSIVTRSVDGEEQFSGTYRARINRDAGHPGQGSSPVPGRVPSSAQKIVESSTA